MFDVTGYVHPGGVFIFELLASGREVDCFMYGGYALEGTKMAAYDHSDLGISKLMSMYIGDIMLPAE